MYARISDRSAMPALAAFAARYVDIYTARGESSPHRLPGSLARLTRVGRTGDCWFGDAPRAVAFALGDRLVHETGDVRIMGRLAGGDTHVLAAFGRHGEDHRYVDYLPAPEGLTWFAPDGFVRLGIPGVAWIFAPDTLEVMSGDRTVACYRPATGEYYEVRGATRAAAAAAVNEMCRHFSRA